MWGGLEEHYLNPEHNEILFESRNKSYGAYELRTQYVKLFIRAFLFAVLIFILLLTYPVYSKWFHRGQHSMFDIDPNQKVVEVNTYPSGAKIDVPSPPKTEKLKSTSNQKDIDKTNAVPIKKSEIPSVKKDQTEILEEKKGNTSSQESDTKKSGDNAGIDTSHVYKFSELDHLPQFPGNLQDFIGRNLIYPQQAVQKQIDGTIIIYFEINKDGLVENIQIKKGLGYGCDEEAKRVVARMPKWIPGIFNSHPVRASYVMPIEFRLR